MTPAAYALGIDLGGSAVKAVAVTAAGRVLAATDAPCGPATRGWKAAVRRAAATIASEMGREPTWTGVAAPGLPARDRRRIACMPGRFPGLEGLDFQRLLRAGHDVPVTNDAQAALLGEAWLGAARGARNALLVTLGTGVGGATMVDGLLLSGHIGRAGHVGHISLDPGGPPDICRTPGSLEDAIGECTIARRTGGRFTSTAALVAAATRGDVEARTAWRRSVAALAAALASLVNVLDPAVIVVGGGIAAAGPALFSPLRRDLARFEWRPTGSRVRLVAARLGPRAGAIGAARLAITHHATEDSA